MENYIIQILDRLRERFPVLESELEYKSEFELLVAVILSAQCTDKRVNLITKELFKLYNTPEQFAKLTAAELIPHIFSCGFYNNKAKSIIEASKDIADRFNGRVPQTIDELMTLRGVGRKTANVMYAVAFGGQAIAVDTHVFRVSNRTGLVCETTPEKTEIALRNIIPPHMYSDAHHMLLFQGRYVCKSRSPECGNCNITGYCKYYNRPKEGAKQCTK